MWRVLAWMERWVNWTRYVRILCLSLWTFCSVLPRFLSAEKLLVATSSALSNPRDGSPQLECMCYGLGSFSSSMPARYQLAMLLLLLEATQVTQQFYSRRQGNLYLRPCSLGIAPKSCCSPRLHRRTAVFMTLSSLLERGMFWQSWVWLCSQRMRSVVAHSCLFHIVSKIILQFID